MKSWTDHGYKVYSLNSSSEIQLLQPMYPFITFIPDTQSLQNEKMYGKPYISIASFFDFGQTLPDQVVALVNSDIQLKYNKAVLDNIEQTVSKGGFVIGKRYNYSRTYQDARIEGAGVDFFVLNRDHLPLLPRTYQFVMGQCWWDYWLPTVISDLKIPTYKINHPLLYHKKHPLQWSQKLWHELADLFCKDTKYILGSKTPPQISHLIHDAFYNKAIPLNLPMRTIKPVVHVRPMR